MLHHSAIDQAQFLIIFFLEGDENRIKFRFSPLCSQCAKGIAFVPPPGKVPSSMTFESLGPCRQPLIRRSVDAGWPARYGRVSAEQVRFRCWVGHCSKLR